MPRPVASDRGEQMAFRARNPTTSHMGDVHGAAGCYYCWLGEFSKCRDACTKVKRGADYAVTGVAAAGTTTPPGVEVWRTAGKHCEAYAQQSRSMYAARTARPRSPAATRTPQEGRAARLGIASLHAPQQFVPRFTHAPGTERIQATPYTTVAVQPTARSYTSKHEATAGDDAAIWSGALVKSGRRAPTRAAPSSVARRLAVAAEAVNRPGERTAVANYSRGSFSAADLTEADLDAHRAAARCTPRSGPGARGVPEVRHDEHMSAILSGGYGGAFDLPLPATFAE